MRGVRARAIRKLTSEHEAKVWAREDTADVLRRLAAARAGGAGWRAKAGIA